MKKWMLLFIPLICLWTQCASQKTAQRKAYENKLISETDRLIGQLDRMSAQGFQMLRRFQKIKADVLEKEKKRLSEKLGKRHPRVKEITKSIKENNKLTLALKTEIQKAEISVSDYTAQIWLVHGRVLNGQSLGVPGLTVSFFDQNQNWIEEPGYTITDAIGYYALTYCDKKNENPVLPETKELYLTISDSEQNILHRAGEPLYVKFGQIDYLDISIVDPDQSGTPPATH